jgi:hypothetical protein
MITLFLNPKTRHRLLLLSIPAILLATETNKTTPAEPGSSSMLSPGGTLLRANCYKQTLSTSSISQQILHY